MSGSILLLVLGAALLHASWNIIVKGGSDKLFESGLNCLGGALGALLLLPFLPPPAPASWGFLALSALVHTGYYLGMAAAYQRADFSLGYPVMRGSAPLFTALALSLFGEAPGLTGWVGALLLSAGILCLALEQKFCRHGGLASLLVALAAAPFIMTYTLTDGYGARASGNGVSYACWVFVLCVLPLHTVILTRRGRAYLAYLKNRAVIGLCGGLAGFLSYGVAVWAMTKAPIAYVAALRESSVIFGMVMAVLFLGERLTCFRILAILLVMFGAMMLRLG